MEHSAHIKVFFESLPTPELERRISVVMGEGASHKLKIQDWRDLMKRETEDLRLMKAVIADRNKRGDHMPLYSPYDGIKRPL